MANPYRGQVDLALENPDTSVSNYRLQYDGNALVEIEEVMGLTMNDIIQNHIKLMDGFKFRRIALFQGLQRDPRGKKLTLVQCGQLVASDEGKQIHEAVLQGVFMALGFDYRKAVADREAEENPKEKAANVNDPLEPED